MSHLRGIPEALRERFGVPVVFYDGDVPMSLPEFGGHDTGFNYYFGADPSEYDLVALELGRGPRAAARAGRPARGGRLLGRRPRALPAAAGREGDRRLLLRLRRQVPARVDAGDGRRAEPAAAGRRLLARRRGLPRRHRPRARRRADPVQRLRPRDLGRADQPQRHAPRARVRPRLVDRAAVRARDVRGDDRLQPPPGIDRWFEPGRELVVVEDADQAAAAYASCSATPGARPRWAGPRASGRSTSTRTSTGPGGCSTCSGWACRRRCVSSSEVAERPAVRGADSRLAGVSRIAIVPALNEEETRRPRDRRDPRVRPRARGRRRRRRLDRPDGGGRRGARGARRPAAVQPRDRRRRPDRLPVRVRARLPARGPPRRRRAARRLAARPAARARPRRRGRHRRRLALRRRRAATGRRGRGAPGSRSSRRRSRCSSGAA